MPKQLRADAKLHHPTSPCFTKPGYSKSGSIRMAETIAKVTCMRCLRWMRKLGIKRPG